MNSEVKKLTIDWLQVNQDSKEDLQREFNSLLYDDKDFQYLANEFLSWVYDCVINVK